MNKLLTYLVAATLGATIGISAQAAAIVSDNVRPVTIGAPYTGESSLQTVLDNLFGVNAINVVTDQSAVGLWEMTSDAGTTIPTLYIEQTSGASTQTFGIWFGTDTDNMLTHPLFYGSAIGHPDYSAAALDVRDGKLSVLPGNADTDCTMVGCTDGWLIDPRISPDHFGFYFTAGDPVGTEAYSIDSITGGEIRFLSFQNGASTNWAFAFEDGTDFDYQDMVVKVESIQAVPEPAVLGLLGLGLVGMAIGRRRKVS